MTDRKGLASELVYFHGAHLAHIVAWEERERLARKRREGRAFVERMRRRLPPIAPPVDIGNATAFPNIAEAIEHARKMREKSHA